MKEVELLYDPSRSQEIIVTEIYGVNYSSFIKPPNVFVVKDVEEKNKDISFKSGNCKYYLTDCVYETHGDNLHIECRNWKVDFLEE